MSLWTSFRSAFRNSHNLGPQRQRFRPAVECLEDRCLLSAAVGFTQVNLASDVPALAQVFDPNLVNPWGISVSPTGPFWLAENGAGVSDILNGSGQGNPLVVTVPSVSQSVGSPTGTVFNGGSGFVIGANGVAQPSLFLFATLDGGIFAWSELNQTNAVQVVDRSAAGAVYTGLALATNASGQSFLYAANVSQGGIDVFDQNFNPVLRAGSFQDPALPQGYVPFNIQNINNRLYVTYAMPDGDDMSGGVVDVYDTAGNLVRRFASGGTLYAPWGVAVAPADFGPFGDALLVGNNGDGRINAYNLESGAYLGQLADDNGTPITIPGLWALTVGNDHEGGNSATLFFAAGVDNGNHGLFGAIQSPQHQGADTAGVGVYDPNFPGERADYPLPPFAGPILVESVDDSPAPTAVLLPLSNSLPAVAPTFSYFAQPITPSSTPIPPTPLAALSFNPSVAAAVLAAGTTSLFPAADDFQPQPNVRPKVVALSTFLDWQPPSSSVEKAEVQQPFAVADDASSFGASAENGSEGSNLAVVAPIVPISGVPVSEQVDTQRVVALVGHDDEVKAPNHDSRISQLRSLLFAIGVPMLSSYLVMRRRRSGQLGSDLHGASAKKRPAPSIDGFSNAGSATVLTNIHLISIDGAPVVNMG